MIRVAIFNEYNGLPIPNSTNELKFRVERGAPTNPPFFELQKVNVKVFAKDECERKLIKELFIDNGFLLDTDHITTTYKRADNSTYTVCTYDRLIFNSPSPIVS